MKRILYILFLFPMFAVGQTQSMNYIKNTTYKEPTTTSVASPTVLQANQSITYFDGLGDPIQQISSKQSATAKNIVQHIEYDALGRQTKEFLPYTSQTTGLDYESSASIDLLNYPKYTGETPFSEKLIEASPLERITARGAVGNNWALNSGHELKIEYNVNGASEVKYYKANSIWSASINLYNINFIYNGYYAEGSLYKTITKNENWKITDINDNTTQEFKDNSGNIVLIRRFESNTPHDTYYVYDQYVKLTYVIPPAASDIITQTTGGTPPAIDTSTAIVTAGSNLQLTATNSVRLLPGFHAQAGSNFNAFILVPNNNTITLDNFCYQYKYDSRNRLVEKKVPGKEWEYIVYNKLDQPILIQDANLRAQNKWLFTKYDVFNRPTYTGEYLNSTQTTRFDVQNLANLSTIIYETKQTAGVVVNGTTIYYTNNAFPTANIDLFAIKYNDNYNFDINGGISELTYTISPSVNVKGLVTGSKIRILGTNNWTTSIIHYDDKLRPIYLYNKNDYLGTIDKVKSKLDFIGKTNETTSTHTRAGVTTTIINAFTYDHADRLLAHKQKINSQAEEIIASNTYDELGQLTSKGVGGIATRSNRLQTVDFDYNIRGWLKNINKINTIGNDLFAFQINYNVPTAGGTALYNGNISQTHWKTANIDSSVKKYNYTYDALNRLTQATDNLNKLNESLMYDKNGNITYLKRLGEIVGGVPNITIPTNFGVMDDLTYSYTGNQLQIVSDNSNDVTGFKDDFLSTSPDTTTDYTYDLNGNMLTDTNKGITAISYNHLNLPKQVTMSGGVITYVYDATGAKQRKIVSGTTTDYAGGYIYENNVMKFFSHPEGYAENNNNLYSYIYQYKDHLGNVRLSYKDMSPTAATPSLQIIEENNYYPFGLKHKGYNYGITSTSPAQKYKYNGKELQDELGLNMYDYGARNYDPAIGRWMNIDPLAEVARRFSPYTYANNNPNFFIDPDGMRAMGFSMSSTLDPDGMRAYDPIDYVDGSGKKIGTDGTNEVGVVVVTNKDDINNIVNAEKSGNHLPIDQVSNFVIAPTDKELAESLNVLDRMNQNGGLKEEASSVGLNGVIIRTPTGGLPSIDGDGIGTATTSVATDEYFQGKGATTIHGHPTSIFEQNEKTYPFNALTPTPGSDSVAFSKGVTNIIVGKIDPTTATNVTRDQNGRINDYRKEGIAVYKSYFHNSTVPILTLTTQAVKNILNR